MSAAAVKTQKGDAMPFIQLPTPMRVYVNGQSEVAVKGQTVQAAMEDLVKQFPAMQPHLYNERGELRPFVNLFIGQVNIKELQGLQTRLASQDRIRLVPAIAGG